MDHGVEIEKEVEWPKGGTSLYFRDPAGSSVELVTRGLWGLPSRWRETSMPKRIHRRASKRRAIQAALGQLGWHASGKEVVALLASYGIDVSEGLVSKVKVESLKKSEEVKRQKERVKSADKRRKRPMTQKKPQQRTYRR